MWFKEIFGVFSRKKIIQLLREEGSLVGEQLRGGRKIYIYILRDIFVQVIFKKDNPVEEVEQLQTFSDLNQLNSHLEKEFKAAF